MSYKEIWPCRPTGSDGDHEHEGLTDARNGLQILVCSVYGRPGGKRTIPLLCTVDLHGLTQLLSMFQILTLLFQILKVVSNFDAYSSVENLVYIGLLLYYTMLMLYIIPISTLLW